MERRSFVRTTATLLPVVLAGCSAGGSGSENGTTNAATESPTSRDTARDATADTRTETPGGTDTPPEAATPTPTPTQTPTERGIRVGMHAAKGTFTTLDGSQRNLADYRGEKVLLWFVATWCPSCQTSAAALRRHHQQLQSLRILAVKMHQNAGYDGPTIREFAEQYAPETLEEDHWTWGRADRETTRRYDPRTVVDIFYLIDEEGIIRTVDRVPTTTINKITRFANR